MTEITSAGRQLAADLANAVCIEREECAAWRSRDFAEDAHHESRVALARLATQSIARDAELAEAKDDLREIDQLCAENGWFCNKVEPRGKITAIAAKHRETDPLYEALFAVVELGRYDTREQAALLRAELAKRGIELAVKP